MKLFYRRTQRSPIMLKTCMRTLYNIPELCVKNFERILTPSVRFQIIQNNFGAPQNGQNELKIVLNVLKSHRRSQNLLAKVSPIDPERDLQPTDKFLARSETFTSFYRQKSRYFGSIWGFGGSNIVQNGQNELQNCSK